MVILVIVSGVTFQWGQHGRGAHRFMAFDKKTGDTMWISAPGGRPYDTTYAAPIIANINGTRLLIQGASDGVVHAIKPQTGEPVWKYEISKRGLNTGVVVHGTTAILTHSEENLDSSEMGMMVAVDANSKGEIKKEQTKWSIYGWQGGFSSPVLDGDRLYQLDNGANIAAFDVSSGKQLWLQNLGTIQKASPVLADGKLYVGTENGKFFILEPSATGAKILDEDQLGTAATARIYYRLGRCLRWTRLRCLRFKPLRDWEQEKVSNARRSPGGRRCVSQSSSSRSSSSHRADIETWRQGYLSGSPV